MFGMDSRTGKALSGDAHLAQSIRDILTTRIGTRVMRRDYGSEIPGLVDMPVSDDNIVDIFAAVADALDKWEPRLRLDRVEVASALPGKLELNIYGARLDDKGKPFTLEGVIIT